MVKKVEDWKWSSLWRREGGNEKQKKLLSEWPIDVPNDYLNFINTPQTNEELESLRCCVNRGRPYGNESWTEKMINKFNLKTEFNKRLKNLSGGTRQKVNACIAFLFDPDILILDEPTAGLDPLSSSILKDKILEENEKGKTIIFTSHLLTELERLAQDVIFLLDGRICFHGTITDLISETKQADLERAIASMITNKCA